MHDSCLYSAVQNIGIDIQSLDANGPFTAQDFNKQ